MMQLLQLILSWFWPLRSRAPAPAKAIKKFTPADLAQLAAAQQKRDRRAFKRSSK